MLATVLKGEMAIQQSIVIMRAFKNLRHYVIENRQLASKEDLQRIAMSVGEYQKKTDKAIQGIENRIEDLSDNFITDTDLKSLVVYKGQKFEADLAYIDIYKKAKKSIYVVDDYVNIKTLHLLSHKKKGVHVVLFTENGFGRPGFLTSSEVTDFINEYPTLQIKPNQDCHDRFIVLDYGTKDEKVFHCGASSKDAGKKVCVKWFFVIIKEFESAYRDDLIFMVLQAKDALGRKPGLNEDLLDIKKMLIMKISLPGACH